MIFHAYGTIGVGDSMSYLNVAHAQAYLHNTQVELYIHWPHGPEHLHHHEDPETIVERIDYIHMFYKDSSSVKLHHIFNDHDDFLRSYYMVTEEQYITNHVKPGEGLYSDGQKASRVWLMDKDKLNRPTQHKIVIWRPTFNAEKAREWKQVLDKDQWDIVIDKCRELGYNVVELCYRTPIREALYHISTSKHVICYDGMWHYISVNLFKPTAITAKSSIGMSNTINGVIIRGPSELYDILDCWDTPKPKWQRMKRNPDSPEPFEMPRFTFHNITGEEYLIKYNDRIYNRLQRAMEHKVDWTKWPILTNEEHRKAKLDNANRQSSN